MGSAYHVLQTIFLGSVQPNVSHFSPGVLSVFCDLSLFARRRDKAQRGLTYMGQGFDGQRTVQGWAKKMILGCVDPASKLTNNSLKPLISLLQRWAKVCAPGLVNIIPAVAYHFCPTLPAAFTQPIASTLADLCT